MVTTHQNRGEVINRQVNCFKEKPSYLPKASKKLYRRLLLHELSFEKHEDENINAYVNQDNGVLGLDGQVIGKSSRLEQNLHLKGKDNTEGSVGISITKHLGNLEGLDETQQRKQNTWRICKCAISVFFLTSLLFALFLINFAANKLNDLKHLWLLIAIVLSAITATLIISYRTFVYQTMRKSFELFVRIVLARVSCTSSECVEQHRPEEIISHREQSICRSPCSIYAIAVSPRLHVDGYSLTEISYDIQNILQGDESISWSTETECSPAESVSSFSRNVNPMISVTNSECSTPVSLTNDGQSVSLSEQEKAYPIQTFTEHDFLSPVSLTNIGQNESLDIHKKAYLDGAFLSGITLQYMTTAVSILTQCYKHNDNSVIHENINSFSYDYLVRTRNLLDLLDQPNEYYNPEFEEILDKNSTLNDQTLIRSQLEQIASSMSKGVEHSYVNNEFFAASVNKISQLVAELTKQTQIGVGHQILVTYSKKKGLRVYTVSSAFFTNALYSSALNDTKLTFSTIHRSEYRMPIFLPVSIDGLIHRKDQRDRSNSLAFDYLRFSFIFSDTIEEFLHDSASVPDR